MNEIVDAIAARDTAALTRLLAGGADPAAVDDGAPVFLLAVESGVIDLARPFLDAGLPIDTHDSTGTAALNYAASAGHLPMVRFLLARGAAVDHRGDGFEEVGTALGAAVEAGALDVVTELLAAGADPDLPRVDGWTPLMLAAHEGSTEIVRALLAAGADVLATRHHGEVDALSVAEAHHHDDVARLLREHGSPDPVDACAARLAVLVEDIAGWLAANARPAHERLVAGRGAADPAAVAGLQAATGLELPTEFRAYLRLFGGTDGLDVFEYDGLPVDRMLGRWRGLTELRADGTFDAAVPHELAPDNGRVQCTWWHPGWIPFAQDGGGNLYCLDLAPSDDGAPGQIIKWEMHGGPFGPVAWSFEEHLRRYRDRLLSGKYVYDEYSGTYDSPA